MVVNDDWVAALTMTKQIQSNVLYLKALDTGNVHLVTTGLMWLGQSKD